MMTMVGEGAGAGASKRMVTWVVGLCLLGTASYLLANTCVAQRDGDQGLFVKQPEDEGGTSWMGQRDIAKSQLFLNLESQAKDYRKQLAARSKHIHELQDQHEKLREELTKLRRDSSAPAQDNTKGPASPLESNSMPSEAPSAPAHVEFYGHWEEATDEAWDSMLRRRGCKDVDYVNKVQCCNPKYFRNFTTPLRQQRFVSPFPFAAYKLERLMRGGTIVFIGDSITSQIYDALRARARREKYYSAPMPSIPPLATAGLQYHQNRSGEDVTAFQTILYRVDKAPDVDALMKESIPDRPSAKAQGHEPRYVVVANIGLHFADTHEDRSAEFRQQIERLARALAAFNKHRGNFGFFRDITPQHFKARDPV